jgi:hypothetical protein
MPGSQSDGSINDATVPLLTGSPDLGPNRSAGELLHLIPISVCQCSMNLNTTGDVHGRVGDVGINAPTTTALPTTQTASLIVDDGIDTSGTVSVSGEISTQEWRF